MNKTIHISYLLLLLISFRMQVQGQTLPLACTGSQVRYGVSGLPNSVYDWEVAGGTIIQNYNDSIDVLWNDKASMGQIKVTEHTFFNCIAAPEYANIVVNSPTLSLGSFLNICQGQTVELKSNSGFVKYIWNTGDTSKVLSVSAGGWYKLKASDANGCSAFDSVLVSVDQLPKVNLGKDTSVCSTELVLDAGSDGLSYLWSNGATTQTIAVSDERKAQLFTVEVRNSMGCLNSDTIKILPCKGTAMEGIPNTFTPNGDNFNDTWNIQGLESYSNVSVEIFDRWGRLVFQSKHGLPAGGWDGMSRGRPLPMDSYYYIIKLNNGTEPIPGTVTIVR